MSKATLVIMAAGIGSRFGQGIKQLTGFGPAGEIIMDYSIYDAKAAGFDRVVFVIRHDLEKDFHEVIGSRIGEQIEVAYAFQEKEDLPEGFTVPADRKKPWGTGQAILACRGLIHEPFAVINADDYYGPEAFELLYRYLTDGKFRAAEESSGSCDICMAGFVLRNTLSEHGGVTRGLCAEDEAGHLIGITETHNIVKTADGAAVQSADGTQHTLDPDALVSMNMWGFPAKFLDVLEGKFAAFLRNHGEMGDIATAEFLLPTIVDGMIRDGSATVMVLPTSDKWFGVTYHEDIPAVRGSFKALAEDGTYPDPLWG